MMITVLIGAGIGILMALLVLIIKLPTKIQYVEEIEVNASIKETYDAIRFQERLMKWSAWPSETNSQCAVKNVDGEIKAQTVFLQKGKQFGYQEVTDLVENEKVSFYLTSKAPFEQDTHLHFYLKELGETNTRVMLYFNNLLKRPSHIFPHVFGLVQWTHGMHLKDLAGLKAFVER